MTFRITNSLKGKWYMLFIETVRKIVTLISEQGIVTEIDEVLIGDKQLISGRRIIIDKILLFCSNLEAILVYIQCVCKLFHKYCVRFWLYKCLFLKESVEYVGHSVTEDENYPARPKFDFINGWKLRTNGQVLFSFI